MLVSMKRRNKKINYDTSLSIKIPEEVKDYYTKIAVKENKNLSQVIRKVLIDSTKQEVVEIKQTPVINSFAAKILGKL